MKKIILALLKVVLKIMVIIIYIMMITSIAVLTAMAIENFFSFSVAMSATLGGIPAGVLFALTVGELTDHLDL